MKADLVGVFMGDPLARVLVMGDEHIYLKFDSGQGKDLVEGQRIRIRGRFDRGDFDIAEVHKVEVAEVLSSSAEGKAFMDRRREARFDDAVKSSVEETCKSSPWLC